MVINKKIGNLSTIALVFLITGAVDSIRNLPTTALFGSSLIFFFIFSAIIFLIPTALVSAELASNHPEKSGIYHWTRMALGEKIGFLSIWLQWINTMVWFPTILSFIASTATYFINPALAENKLYLISIILIVFWSMTFLNLKGIKVSAKFSNISALIGIFLPMMMIIGLAIYWVLTSNPIQIHFTANDLLPALDKGANWISLTAIMTAYLGIELSTVHVNDVKNPQKSFPRAMGISVILILVTMILGSLSIAFVLPKQEINLVSGIMQAFTLFFNAYHLGWMIPILTVMLLIGSLGNMTSWIISPAKGLLQAAEHGFLPAFFSQTNSNGVAKNLLILQAVLVSIMSLAFYLMPSVNGSYWLLSALSTQLYILMYVLMFIAAIILKKRDKKAKNATGFKIPGGYIGHLLACIIGLIGCAITLIVGFIPPEELNIGSALHYEITFCAGLIGMILPVFLFYLYQSKNKP